MSGLSTEDNFDDIKNLNVQIDTLTDELKQMMIKTEQRGITLTDAENRRFDKVQQKLNDLKFKRRKLLNIRKKTG